MKLLCLMPTYGRRKALLENSIACFLSQTHEDKLLLIYDDLGTLKGATLPDKVHSISTPIRCNSVGEKYNILMDMVPIVYPEYQGVVVWDDDDIYLPKHLETHNIILEQHAWSKPSKIISAYFNPPQLEVANGRFHGSIAARMSTINIVEGWINTTRATFDQEMIARLHDYSPPGDPCTVGPPQYVYRWQTTQAGHCSGLMGHPDWYKLYKPDSLEPITSLEPYFDTDTLNFKNKGLDE